MVRERARHILRLLPAAALGAVIFAVGALMLTEPLGVALWAVTCVIVLLPVAYQEDRLAITPYVVAAASPIVGTFFTAGGMASLVIGAVVASLIGGAALFAALRAPATFAIAATIIGASLAFTWPIWSAGLLATYDLGDWLQRLVNISPAFALNAAIAPDDPLTHRPLAYRLMNLGQDVSYAMPASVWPCVMLHAGIGVVGMMGRGLTLRHTQGRPPMNTDKPASAETGHPEGA